MCSFFIVLVGLITLPTLAISQYPQIAPPTVTVTATYIGASAETVEQTVTIPLEEAINGTSGIRYISSQSTNNGTVTITCTFSLDTNLDIAATDVQNSANTALGQLPSAVQQTGLIIKKNSGSFVVGFGLYPSDARMDTLTLANYADISIVDALKRIKGVGDVRVFGDRRYAMRVWVDPKRLNAFGLTATDVAAAIAAQNVQVAAGAIGQPPVPTSQPFQIPINVTGRLADPQQFANIILKVTPSGGFVRIRDVGHVDLGAQDYSTTLFLNGQPAVGIGVLQLPDANALDVSTRARAEMARLAQRFPPGIAYKVAFDSTNFVRQSIKEVLLTLLTAIGLVVIVIFLFLQDWRTTLIPAVTIPISLIGTFFFMKFFGFTINTLTLFGLTLATGLVVDDAIVVIENIARFIQDKKMERMAAAEAALKEIYGAVVASSLVLLSVFVPVGFFPGTTGRLYQQFALTIACAIGISLFCSLTLTPVMSRLLIAGEERSHGRFFDIVNAIIAWTRRNYDRSLRRTLRRGRIVGALFVLGLLATALLYAHMPTAFIPDEDVGYFLVQLQAPDGTSLPQTSEIALKAARVIREQPEVANIFSVQGFSFVGQGSNFGLMFVPLKLWDERPGVQHRLSSVLRRVNAGLSQIPDATVVAFNPPAISGVGNVGGFQFELEDTGNVGFQKLTAAARQFTRRANTDPNLRLVYTTFRANAPQLVVDVDRDKAQQIGVSIAEIFNTLAIYLGSDYVNDFTYLNRSFRVYAQAETPFRLSQLDFQRIFVRSATGGTVPLSQLVHVSMGRAAPVITHYNLFRNIEILGQPALGHGSGDAIDAMGRLAKNLPSGMQYEWTGIALEETTAGSQSLMIFLLGIVFTFLVLAAKYESLSEPLIILFTVPLAILGALLGLWMRGFPSDVYAQVGYVMLIGLASKNAILIVEFANQQREQGKSPEEAVTMAAEIRLRPILMTSIAFIISVVPLVLATGAGSHARNSLGSVVFFGMVLSTILNLYVIPV
ncbi:MAG: efflux RND transporter permease subunit, partial [Candidatus Eremiobacteraeota bacterium]|nr:efflux RND transporter permease subunit [Candidatus Eremiobacteraeota bacterium]